MNQRNANPTVSVVMPVYNQERYVADAVKSILLQTFRDYEFIVVDDGSTDRTFEIVESFKDSRIRLIRAQHRGFVEALKLGTAEAKGKWIARMDSDDVCSTIRLEKQLDFLDNHPECTFVTTFYGIVTLNDKFLVPSESSKWHYLKGRDITFASRPFCDPGTVFDREIALEIGYDDKFNWEKTLWYEMLTKGKGAVMEDPLYFVRWRMGSVSRGQIRLRADMSYEMQLKYDPENAQKPERTMTSNANVKIEKKCVYFYSAAGDFKAARKIAFETWLRFPFRLETIKLVFDSLGIRRMKWVLGPAGIKLFPVDSPLRRF